MIRLAFISCTAALGLILASCGNDGLGMSVDVQETEAPAVPPNATLREKVGDLTIAGIDGIPAAELTKLAQALPDKGLPTGTLTVTKLSIRNRQMEYPARASALLDATLIWQTEDGNMAYVVNVATHSIPLDDPKTQLEWLRDEARRGMWRQLLKKL